MNTILNILKYVVIIILGFIAFVYFIDCCDQQHQELVNKYQQEVVENQRGL